MKANDTYIRTYLEGSKQFIVPLYQRTYSWKNDNVLQFWEDINNTMNNKSGGHFFGSFVTMPVASSPSKISQYVIIDGQQRLITVCTFLAALKNRMGEISPDCINLEEIKELYLVNKHYPENRHKVLPSQDDRLIFFEFIDSSNPQLQDEHLLEKTYHFFRKKLSKIDSLEDLIALENTVLENFDVVDIRIEPERGDDPYLIFESLNAKGTPLTQADLVRNYLFMRINNEEKQQEVYKNVWHPMQQRIGNKLENFIRHYLAMEGDIPTFNKIYATFKRKADKDSQSEDEVINLMKELQKFSNYYYKFLHPEKEGNEKLKTYFQKFNRIELTTSYPLLLQLYEDYINDNLSADEFSKCLGIIETYVIRRAVCGIPAQALNKFFPTIYKSLEKDNVTESLKHKLKNVGGTRRMPDDEEFKKCLIEKPLNADKILRYLLRQIEKHNNKEVVNFKNLQIEHIMPQTLSNDWKKMLGSNWELIHQKYLDTLGNLTLTGYNQEYSNRTFLEKRNMNGGFRNSGLKINRDLAELDNWNEDKIKERAEKLSNIALEIWSI